LKRKRPTHRFRNILLTAYVAAILWTSVAHAFGNRTTATAASVPSSSAPSPTGSKVASDPQGRLGIRAYIEGAAKTTGVDPQVAEWIVTHESSHHPEATGDGGDSRGLWQINKEWHPEVSDACAYNVTCSTDWSLERIHAGHVDEWSTWKYCKQRFADCPFDSPDSPSARNSSNLKSPFAEKTTAPDSFWSYERDRPAIHGEANSEHRALRR
jgi:hypothetical protein